jgi:pimeloyl-ACP methyl ester carboxylesterase
MPILSCARRLGLEQAVGVTKLQVPIAIGEGAPIAVLHGFAMKPATYGALAKVLAERCRVVIPDLFDIPGRWRYESVLDAFTSVLDDRGIERVTLLGHSFGGGIELGFAAKYPERVEELVFSDTLADSREWGLASEALRHPERLLWLATPDATKAFAANALRHPRQLVGAGLWAFRSNRDAQIQEIARRHIPSHVLWANRDSILSRPDGQHFAEDLGADFTLASPTDRKVVDHDWMFEQPDLFVSQLEKLDLEALSY